MFELTCTLPTSPQQLDSAWFKPQSAGFEPTELVNIGRIEKLTAFVVSDAKQSQLIADLMLLGESVQWRSIYFSEQP